MKPQRTCRTGNNSLARVNSEFRTKIQEWKANVDVPLCVGYSLLSYPFLRTVVYSNLEKSTQHHQKGGEPGLCHGAPQFSVSLSVPRPHTESEPLLRGGGGQQAPASAIICIWWYLETWKKDIEHRKNG